MLKKLLLPFVIFLADCHFAFAFTVTPTGTEATVEYQEPNTNADGSALNDLNHTTIYFSTDEDGEGTELLEVPATSSAGNGQITKQVVIPALDVPEGEETVVFVWATASDKNGNESVPSEKVSITVDRLAPGAPK